MKAKIHPKYYNDAKVTCACGNTFTTGSTLPEINVDICAACHPFFTGEMKLIDTQGRIERFQTREKKAAKMESAKKRKIRSKKRRERPQSLKQMLTDEIKKTSQKTPDRKKATLKS